MSDPDETVKMFENCLRHQQCGENVLPEQTVTRENEMADSRTYLAVVQHVGEYVPIGESPYEKPEAP